ncbi:MHYT domain-containing protein [Paenibacillus sp. GCM10012303]|uniref:MHYT domain-containing protein n=1 Tax=Paenibacillus sp. GCM10012303 TaxID=3317340 RepID=UPI0036234BB4
MMEYAHGHYNYALVVLSVVIAVAASYGSLDLTGRASKLHERSRKYALISVSAITLGLGIWSMHFVGMLALKLPQPVTYHLMWTLFSLLLAIGSSFLAILLVCRSELSLLRFSMAGLCMGGGIATMHYVGMEAIRSGCTIHYELLPFVISILIAIVVSYWALYLTFRLQKKDAPPIGDKAKTGGALLLGGAISGMHYTGMKASHFMSYSPPYPEVSLSESWHFLQTPLSPGVLSVWMGVTVFFLVVVLIGGAFIDRRLALESAKSSILQFDALYNNNPDLVCTFDLEGKFLHTNQAAKRLTGYTQEELRGRSYRSLLPPDRIVASNRLFEMVKQGQAQHFESVFLHKHGHLLDLSVTGIPMKQGERVVAVIAIFKDITQHKQNEEHYRKSDKLGMAGQLAAGVAHEIRNPLTTIKGFVQLLRGGAVKEEFYEIMSSEIMHIDRIITEFLLLANHQQSEYVRTNPAELMGQVLTLVQSQANMNNVAIETQFEPELPELLVDRNKLKQAFVNLVKNAIESMTMSGRGTVKVEIRRKGGTDMLFRITDEGIGISSEMKAKLGEPFYSTKEKGTGLGLMVCYKIINEHQGHIEYSDAPVRGTIVEVTLPVPGGAGGECTGISGTNDV